MRKNPWVLATHQLWIRKAVELYILSNRYGLTPQQAIEIRAARI